MALANRKSKIENPLNTYWDRSQRPMQALIFLTPLLLVYEAASVVAVAQGQPRLPKILAESWLGRVFESFGVTGYYLPAIIVVVVLICMHVARRDAWSFEPRLYALMAVEAVLLAVPLFVFMLVLFRAPSLQEAMAAAPGIGGLDQTRLIHTIGAGIYEEMLFRLIAIALLHLVLVDVLALPEHVGASAAVILSALAFAAYHFESIPAIREHVGRFLFFTLAGIYLAAVYLLRGYGIVAVTHTMYDVYVLALERMQSHA